MKLKLKTKIAEQDEDLKSHQFSKEEIKSRVDELDRFLHRAATPLQEKVPVQIAQEYFLRYASGHRGVSAKDMHDSEKIATLADESGLVRVADIFILAEIYNNIDLSWMLDKYK